METNDKKSSFSGWGLWSFLGLFFLLLWITFLGGVNYAHELGNIVKLVVGNVAQIPAADTTLLGNVLEITATVLLMLPISLMAGAIFSGRSKSYDYENLKGMLERGPWVLFLVVLLEELFARGLFLGLLTKLFTGNLAFYILFILGNGIWAILHLSNFKNEVPLAYASGLL